MTVVSSRDGGDAAQSAVLELVPELRYVSNQEDEHIDAATTDRLEGSGCHEVSIDGALESETAVEIKSAMAVYGEAQTRGRFYLRKGQHEHILDLEGAYLFAVCEPTPSRDVIAAKIVPTDTVEELVSSWISVENIDRAEQAYAQIAWSRIFDVQEVEP